MKKPGRYVLVDGMGDADVGKILDSNTYPVPNMSYFVSDEGWEAWVRDEYLEPRKERKALSAIEHNRIMGLDLIDETICGLYGQDSLAIWEVDSEVRDDLHREYDRVLDMFRAWRIQYNEFASDEDEARCKGLMQSDD